MCRIIIFFALLTAAPALALAAQRTEVVSIATGRDVVLSATADGSEPFRYEWRKDGQILSGHTSQALRLTGVGDRDAGIYDAVVSNPFGAAVTQNAIQLVVDGSGNASGPTRARLSNVSVLAPLAAGESFGLGFVVGGAGTIGAKPLVVRAVGPSLTPFGVSNPVADPQFEAFARTDRIATNDNWSGARELAEAFSAVGAFPLNAATSRDAAALVAAGNGDHSVRISAVGTSSGTVLGEIYDATPVASFSAQTPRLINLSVLKTVGLGLTAGFVVVGPGKCRVLVRAVGPGLAAHSVTGALQNPELSLFSGTQRIGANDDWGGEATLIQQFSAVGAFPLSPSSRDSALSADLEPGNYSVRVSGVGGSQGVVLIELYEVQP